MKYYKTSYRGSWSDAIITGVEVERTTEESVWVDGRRNAKISSYDNYFPTWEDAHNWLAKKCFDDMARVEDELGRIKNKFDQIDKMQKP